MPSVSFSSATPICVFSETVVFPCLNTCLVTGFLESLKVYQYHVVIML